MHVKEQWVNAVKEKNRHLLIEPNAVFWLLMLHKSLVIIVKAFFPIPCFLSLELFFPSFREKEWNIEVPSHSCYFGSFFLRAFHFVIIKKTWRLTRLAHHNFPLVHSTSLSENLFSTNSFGVLFPLPSQCFKFPVMRCLLACVIYPIHLSPLVPNIFMWSVL
jgi:hypothetical protein